MYWICLKVFSPLTLRATSILVITLRPMYGNGTNLFTNPVRIFAVVNYAWSSDATKRWPGALPLCRVYHSKRRALSSLKPRAPQVFLQAHILWTALGW